MRLAMISDTHFGDEDSTLVQKHPTQGLTAGTRYKAFFNAAGKENDYLVLAGDIFDFSIAPYEKAYLYARAFFELIKKDGVAKRVLYLPGNHDADMWHILQHQRSIIKRLEDPRKELPVSLAHSIPAVIDDRNSAGDLVLHGVRRNAGTEPYGGMFLDNITASEPTKFLFAFPNLYIAAGKEVVAVTHGHYLEDYWSLGSETVPVIASDRFKPGDLDIETVSALNFPLNQLSCTGIGQAGILTEIARELEKEVEGKRAVKLDAYADRAIDFALERIGMKFPLKTIASFGLRLMKQAQIRKMLRSEPARKDEKFLTRPDIKERFKRYYSSCAREIDEINEDRPNKLPYPSKVIFGHTHHPIPWNNPDRAIALDSGGNITLSNMGGWLETNGVFCGAEVFTYETGIGFSSKTIL
ncbi:MAG: metallophosphoesterase [Rectinemataceae bacterium]|jgi:UDP-2,3-diacylglucosamine pyrophosphatase LpxH